MTEVFSHLYLGGVDVISTQFLTSNNIVNILTVDIELPVIDLPDVKIHHKHINETDEEDTVLVTYFPVISDWLIKAVNQGNNSLVHCRHGVSRSATMVIATIMKMLDYDYEKAFAYMQSNV